MPAKRIYQIAKEFECEEKKIIDFLTTQGIKVSNRLSAVSEDTYNLLKTKLFAPPPPPPEPKPELKPEPKPEPVVEKTEQVASAATETPAGEAPAQPAKKKKKKKKKNPQANVENPDEEEQEDSELQKPFDFAMVEAATQKVAAASLFSGTDFINHYTKGVKSKNKAVLYRNMDVWGLLQDLTFDDPDSSPIKYWQAVNKLTTKAFKLMQEYGMKNREILGEMRELFKKAGAKYEPQEIFTEEENALFESQQKFIFETFSHGMGKVNDNLYELKMYAETKKRACEHISFVDYLTNPDNKLENKIPTSFFNLAETVLYSVLSVPRHVDFYEEYKPHVIRSLDNFYAWVDGYKKLKEQGADAAKLEKYLELEKKFFSLVEFMSYDNLVYHSRKKLVPFELALDLLNEYRDNMDDPDAERNFKYKVRGVTNIIYKPKEYVFLYSFAGLEPNVDYRTPEMIAEAEAKKAAEEAEAAAKAAEEAETAEKENPTEESSEA